MKTGSDSVDPRDVATGPGAGWLRLALAGVAGVYFTMLLHHAPDKSWLRPVAFFTEATCLFPRASDYAIEWRLEAWSCGKEWAPLDPRPYFTIQPEDKESRLQRLGYFYEHNRTVMQALDKYVSAGHASGANDGVPGPIGGIRFYKIVRPFPAAGEPVERYHFDPFELAPKEQRRELYYTPQSERKRRCAP